MVTGANYSCKNDEENDGGDEDDGDDGDDDVDDDDDDDSPSFGSSAGLYVARMNEVDDDPKWQQAATPSLCYSFLHPFVCMTVS